MTCKVTYGNKRYDSASEMQTDNTIENKRDKAFNIFKKITTSLESVAKLDKIYSSSEHLRNIGTSQEYKKYIGSMAAGIIQNFIGDYSINEDLINQEVLGSKMDATHFKDFLKYNRLNPEGRNLNKLERFLEQAGIGLNYVSQIVINGSKVGHQAVANIYRGVIDILDGASPDVLPEEVFHFVVEALDTTDNEAYAKIYNKITQHPIYKETLENYGSLPEYQIESVEEDGTRKTEIDYEKIKKEAIAKLMAEVYIKGEERKSGIKSLLEKLWDSIVEGIKNFINQRKSPSISIEEVRNLIELGLTDNGDVVSKVKDIIGSKLAEEKVYFSTSGTHSTAGQTTQTNTTIPIQESLRDDILKYSEEFELQEENGETFYLHKPTNKRYKRGTKELNDIFMSDERRKAVEGKKAGYFEAKKVWSDQTGEKFDEEKAKTGTITYKTQTVTFEELIEIKTKELEVFALYGTIDHALKERFKLAASSQAKKNKAKIDEIDKKIQEAKLKIELATGGKVYMDQWFNEDVISDFFKNYSNSDYVSLAEVTVGFEDLGIATTIDDVFISPSGLLTVVDLKTGSKFMSDSWVENVMKYAKDEKGLFDPRIAIEERHSTLDTKMNRAKLEVAFRMFLLKMKFPDAKFRNGSVYYVNKNNARTSINKEHAVELNTYLVMIENWLKAEKPDVYEKYSKMHSQMYGDFNLFDKKSYKGVETEFMPNDIVDGTKKIDYEMEGYKAMFSKMLKEINGYRLNEASTPSTAKVKEWKKTLAAIEEYENISGKTIKSDFEDLGSIEKVFIDKYTVRKNPIAKLYMHLVDKADNARTKYVIPIQNEMQRRVKALKDEKRHSTSLAQDVYHNHSGTGLYDFMLELKTVNDVEGYYRKQLTEEDYKKGVITKAQWEFYKFFVETLNTTWDRTMKKVALKRNKGKEETVEDLMKVKIDENFIPRSMIGKFELAQLNQKGLITSTMKSLQNLFVEERNNRFEDEVSFGVPLKWMGSEKIVREQLHTFNMEEALMHFVHNLAHKNEFDEIDALNYAIANIFSYKFYPRKKGQIKSKYENTLHYLDSINSLYALSKDDELDRLESASREDISVSGKFNWKTALSNTSKVTSVATLGLSMAGGFMNFIQQYSILLKKTLTNSISNKLGFGDDATYGGRILIKAIGITAKEKFFLDNIRNLGTNDRTELQKSKLKFFSDMLRYDTDSIGGYLNKKDLQSSNFRIMDRHPMMMTYNWSENGSLYHTMVSLLLKKKVQDGAGYFYAKRGNEWVKLGKGKEAEREATSFWDAYEYDESINTFKYTGPVRGVRDTTGNRKITELTIEEITKLRRASQHIYGSYRKDEKALIEANFYTKLFLMFKRFLPQYIRNFFDGTIDDPSHGNWDKDNIIFDKDGNAIMNWTPNRISGSLHLMRGSFLMAMANITPFGRNNKNLQKWKWENLTELQKQQMVLFMMHLLSTLAFMFAGKFMVDDDDDKNAKFFSRWERLTQDQFGIYPYDIVNTLSNPLPQLTLVKTLMQAYWDVVMSGLGFKERVKTGKNKGDLRGWATVKRKTPILNILTELGFFEEEDDKVSENWFINMMSRR